jgi:hypothetical protein
MRKNGTMKKIYTYFAVAGLLLSIQTITAQAYFQQKVDYSIRVQLDDVRHMLTAEEAVKYTNNSTATLNEIWFHLWPNAYKNNETAFAKAELLSGSTKFQYAKDEARGFIDSLDFKVDGQNVKMDYHPEHQDICKITLNKALNPGETITITTPFRVKIPSSAFSRLGHFLQQYQLCQWYPKPAVFDSKGWHPMPYLNQGEFYSEFGNYEVSITLPENYVVASSGEMISNAEEQARIEANIEQTESWMKAGMVVSKDTLRSASKMKTVVYKLDNVHDFAWFTDKQYKIKRGSVKLERSGRTVDTWIYFTPNNAKAWTNGISYVNDAVKYYSRWVGDYPYNVCKALDGALSAGGGMEYPTITIISPTSDTTQLDEVIAHEVGHNWFYGILASNERDHPWMDEGTNSYYENRYMREKYPDHSLISTMLPDGFIKTLGLDKFDKYYIQTVPYLLCARNAIDQPLNLHSHDYTSINYGTMIYMKTAVAYNYLAAYLGQEKFDAMMLAYFEKWKFKHPYPEDFRAHVEEFTGEKLDWFFDGLIESRKRVDYAIGAAKKTDNGYKVTVRNHGEIAGPVSISIKQDDSQLKTYWFKGSNKKQKLEIPADLTKKTDYISVNGTGQVLDVNPKNDLRKMHGIFRKGAPKIGFITGLERPGKKNIYLLPATGYNAYNGLMLGVGVSNFGIFRRRLEYFAVPMYGVKNKELAGSAMINYQFRPVKGSIQTITIGSSADRYALLFAPNFTKLTGSVKIRFKDKNHARKTLVKDLNYRYIRTERGLFTGIGTIVNNFNVVNFLLTNNHVLKPWSMNTEVQQAKTFVKSSITYERFITYHKKKKGLDLRVFGGAFLYKSNDYNQGVDARFRLSGQNGYQDYLYDNIFLGRQENSGLLSGQMSYTDGAFALPTFLGQSDRFMLAANFKTSLPSKIPFKVYANLAYFGYTTQTIIGGEINSSNATDFAGEAGLSLPIFGKNFEIFFPLVYTKNLGDAFKFTSSNLFEQRIRFVLNIKLFNPLGAIRNLGA